MKAMKHINYIRGAIPTMPRSMFWRSGRKAHLPYPLAQRVQLERVSGSRKVAASPSGKDAPLKSQRATSCLHVHYRELRREGAVLHGLCVVQHPGGQDPEARTTVGRGAVLQRQQHAPHGPRTGPAHGASA